MHKEAAQMFSIALREKEFSYETLDDHFIYAEILERAGDEDGSQEWFRRIAALDPNYREVAEKVKAPLMEKEPEKATEPVSEPVPENSLRALLQHSGKLEPKEALKIWVQALKGLKGYHNANGPHGALSPECILMENGTADIKVQNPHPDYSEKGPLDLGSDIYSMGLILCEMLSGQRGEVSLKSLQSAHPDFPIWLYGILQKCLKPREEGRFGSIDEIFAALKSAAQKK
jgi:hypothetical protein